MSRRARAIDVEKTVQTKSFTNENQELQESVKQTPKELTAIDVVAAAVNGIIKLAEDKKNKGIYVCCDKVVNLIQDEVDKYERRRIKEKMRAKLKH